MKSIVLVGFLILSPLANAASFCNPGGADPLICTSQDGQDEIYIHPRFYIGDVSHNGFCNEGYIKIAGVELNGAADGSAPATPALLNTLSTTAAQGLNVRIPYTQTVQMVSSVHYFEFNNPKYDMGAVLVSLDTKEADLYLVHAGADRPYQTHLICHQ